MAQRQREPGEEDLLHLTADDYETVSADSVRADEPRYWLMPDVNADHEWLKWFAMWRYLYQETVNTPRFAGVDRAVVRRRS